jgi:hypothetical protein
MYAQGISANSIEITYCGGHIHAPPGNRVRPTGQWGVSPVKIHQSQHDSGASSSPGSPAPKRRYTARRATAHTSKTTNCLMHDARLVNKEADKSCGPNLKPGSLSLGTPTHPCCAPCATASVPATQDDAITSYPYSREAWEAVRGGARAHPHGDWVSLLRQARSQWH